VSNGKTQESFSVQPSDWQPWNERAVVWAQGNTFEGVPFEKNYETTPFGWPEGAAPIREVSALPPEAGSLLTE